MIVDRAFAAVLSRMAYVPDTVLDPNGPRGRSFMGLWLAAFGTGILVFECEMQMVFVAVALSLIAYLAYAVLLPNGPHGGSLMGLLFAAFGTAGAPQ